MAKNSDVLNFKLKDYTSKPYARDEKHNSERNGKDFRDNYLEKWLDEYKTIIIDVDDLELPISDSFMHESFCKIIQKYGYEFFLERIEFIGEEAENINKDIKLLKEIK